MEEIEKNIHFQVGRGSEKIIPLFLNIVSYTIISIIYFIALNLYMSFSTVFFSFATAIFLFLALDKLKLSRKKYLFLYKIISVAIFSLYIINILFTYKLANNNIDINNKTSSIDTKSLLLLKPIVQIEFLTTEDLINDIENKKYLNQQIIAKIIKDNLELYIKGALYQEKLIKQILIFLFLFLIFLLLFILHNRVVKTSTTSRKSVNYLILGVIFIVLSTGMIRVSERAVHMSYSELSQEILKNHAYDLIYINKNHKNLYIIEKGNCHE